MNAPFKQDARMGRLSTVLGKDVLNLQTFRGDEHVNGLFTYKIEALADSDSISFDKLIGTNATVHLTSFDLPEVPFDGIITEAELIGEGDRGWRYAFTLKPWIWLMGLRRKQQIYHNKTVVDVLDEVFAPYGCDVTNKLTGAYPTLEYTVQYRESDLAFACRMMERFGISYHFAHDDGAHALVLTDNITAHDDLLGASREFIKARDHRATTEHFWDMRPSQRLTTGKIRLTDYNFKAPDAAMEADRAGAAPYAQGEIESYDYPGDYLDQGAGKKVARLRVDQERGQDPRHRTAGDCASLRAGMCVKVTGETVPGVARALCLSAQHSYTAGGYGTDGGTGEPSYEGEYLLMPDDAPLRPERKTPRSVVQGPQTARVVGDGEIDCDEYGRILVRFHWDLDDRYSMRCRVSQNWAGKGWGGMVIPRIGMEVVVEFLEGDPDKPLVTGCVYNGKNDVPYPLPAHKTRSTFRTDTHKGNGFNELRFEDQNGLEEIFIHAQKDMNERVNNDHAAEVGHNQSHWVGANRSIEVGMNQSTVVSGNMRVAVGVSSGDLNTEKALKKIASKFSSQSSSIARVVKGMGRSLKSLVGVGNLSILVNGNRIENTTKVALENVGVSKSSIVLGTRNEITGTMSHVHVGSHRNEEVVGKHTQSAGEGWEASSGPSQVHLLPDGEIMITAPTIKFRANNIDMQATEEIKIKAAKVKIN